MLKNRFRARRSCPPLENFGRRVGLRGNSSVQIRRRSAAGSRRRFSGWGIKVCSRENRRVGVEAFLSRNQQSAIQGAELLIIVLIAATTLGATLHERDLLLLNSALKLPAHRMAALGQTLRLTRAIEFPFKFLVRRVELQSSAISSRRAGLFLRFHITIANAFKTENA